MEGSRVRPSRFLPGALLLLLAVTSGAQQAASPRPEDGAPGQGRPAFVIPIKGEIGRPLMVFVRRGIQEAKSRGAKVVVFEIDTFGGRVDSALQITTLIGSAPMETVAFVPVSPAGTGVSWSAGSLISLSCQRIYMAPGTSMGAAAPVYQTSQGMQAAPEKEVSAVRAQMAALAEKNGYPKGVALAMVDQDVELLEVYVGGQMRVVTASELPAVERQAAEQGLTVEKGPVISAKGKLLTLTAGEAERYGVSSGTVKDLDALWGRLEVAPGEATILGESAPDRIVGFITSGAVTAILVLIGLVALYLEITSPGFGVPGTVAIIAFAIVFLGGALLGTVGSLELILFLLGVVLLVVEIFLIPGFGVTGVSGIILMLAALVLSRQFFVVPKVSWQWDILLRNLRDFGLAFLGSIVLMLVIFRFFRRAPLLKRLILESSQDSAQGYTVQEEQDGTRLLGRRGVAVTILRPAGKAEFDGEVLAVETEGEFLPAGRQVEVIEVSGNRVVVKGL